MNNYLFKFLTVATFIVIDLIPGLASFQFGIGRDLSNQFSNELQKIIQNRNDKIVAGMQMKVYTGQSIVTATVTDIPITNPDIMYQYIDPTKPLVIYIHGFREIPLDENIQTVVGAYLNRGTDNIFLLDWSKLSWDNYITVFSRIKDIARIFALVFGRLIELGLNIETFHIVGHSMGGQIAGIAGQYSNYPIQRITGLDPAFPGFYKFGAEHIDNTSALFVDIIHTDGGFYGAPDNTGTADIYPNGGVRPQPNCESIGIPLSQTDLCSHWRSWRYYAESVRNIYAFTATQCDSYKDYLDGECENNRVIYIGYDIPTNAAGSYYLITNGQSPYGRNDLQ